MKNKLILIGIILAAAVTSCKKEESHPSIQDSNLIENNNAFKFSEIIRIHNEDGSEFVDYNVQSNKLEVQTALVKSFSKAKLRVNNSKQPESPQQIAPDNGIKELAEVSTELSILLEEVNKSSNLSNYNITVDLDQYLTQSQKTIVNTTGFQVTVSATCNNIIVNTLQSIQPVHVFCFYWSGSDYSFSNNGTSYMSETSTTYVSHLGPSGTMPRKSVCQKSNGTYPLVFNYTVN